MCALPPSRFIRCFIVLLSILFSSLFLTTAAWAEQTASNNPKSLETSYTLQLGQQQEIALGEAPAEIIVSHPDRIEIERVGQTNNIRVRTREAGESRVRVRFPDEREKMFSFLVKKTPARTQTRLSPLMTDLHREVSRIPGMLGKLDDSRVIVTGSPTSTNDFAALVGLWNGNRETLVLNHRCGATENSPCILGGRAFLQALGEKGLKLISSHGFVVLRGEVSSQSALSQISGTLSRLIPELVISPEVKIGNSQPVVQVGVRFLELGRGDLSKFGFSSSQLMSGNPVEVSVNLAAPFASPAHLASLTTFLTALRTSQFSRQLAHPVVLAQLGRQARFVAGGEIPVIVARSESAGESQESVTFRPYGIMVTVTPQERSPEGVTLAVNLEFSSLDASTGSGSIPGFKTRRIETTLRVPERTVALLSGLVLQDDAKAVDKVPILGSFPIVGELFKSRRFQNRETELWLAVEAEVLEAQVPTPSLDDAFKRYDNLLRPSWGD